MTKRKKRKPSTPKKPSKPGELICKTCKLYNPESDSCKFTGEKRLSKASKFDECGAYEPTKKDKRYKAKKRK